jgi:methylenetetrahydrofolate dehydrogenase (NADP+)/methenyltetrahydrofolate cyclohydrolase
MTARIIDGNAIAAQIKNEVKDEVERLKAKGVNPCLAAVLVGDITASKIYVRTKRRTCEHRCFTSTRQIFQKKSCWG